MYNIVFVWNNLLSNIYVQEDGGYDVKGYIASVDGSSLSEDMSVFDGNVTRNFSTSSLQLNKGTCYYMMTVTVKLVNITLENEAGINERMNP